MWREMSFYAAQSGNVIDYHFLDQGLHLEPDKLRTEVQAAIDQGTGNGYDGVLLGYGLCSNGIAGLEAKGTQLIIPRAHDCITLLLGSKERYREYFDDNPTAYWYSPGWIDTGTQPSKKRVESTLAFYRKQYGDDNAEYLMETLENWTTKYNKATYVDLGVGKRENYLSYTRQCAKEMGWKFEELEGDPSLLCSMLEGKWSDDKFLTVEPGRQVQADVNNGIIKTCSGCKKE